jgi:hypothetical protein
MKRSEKFGNRHWEYRATTKINDTLDALDWCKNYKGQGPFHFRWFIETSIDQEKDISGEFHFTDSQDHMMFTMRWVR